MEVPVFFKNNNVFSSVSGYKWDKQISTYISVESKYENEKLEKAFDLLSHKAKIGLAAAISEWIYWCLHSESKNKSIYYAIESLWVSIIDKNYIVNDVNFIEEEIEPQDRVEGPIWRVLFCLTILKRHYLKGAYPMGVDLITLTILARHITNNNECFDKWIANCLLRLSQDFPARYNRVEIKKENLKEYKKGVYDSFDELVIPRDFFFEESFVYDSESVVSLINIFLKEVSYQSNPYLNSPDIMLVGGFKGTPYKYGS
ncbi:hypothetical protein [Pragia fontium]|uniref:hypothetical protein n=1 Tax=Pragia fontium TaxID=82985 RepID=UPI00064A72A0|nr:hypothetical protein [Pragia fontium]AKJ41633.1 hypothetical protein QQ39_05665 [Pragia fontium]